MLDRLGRLQALANSYVETEDSSADPIVLTLSYTRTGDYNTQMWQLTAGVRDAAFENYVNTNDSDLQSLQGMSTVTLPGGQNIDFGHLAGLDEPGVQRHPHRRQLGRRLHATGQGLLRPGQR